MTKAKTERPLLDTSIIAALHRADGMWRGVVGRADGNRLAIIETKDFPQTDPPTVDAWLESHQAGQVIVVLPAGTVICRSCPLPDADPQQLETALRLQAEAQLLGTAPPHRQAMAVLHPADNEQSRSGLILAWPEGNEPEIPTHREDVQFTADVAAVAALLNGHRPADPLLWADGRSGALSFAMTHAGGVTFRATRENTESPHEWVQGVTRTLAETALNASHTPEYIDGLRESVASRFGDLSVPATVLWLPDELHVSLAQRMTGHDPGSDPQSWWNQFGVAAGALLTQADQLAPLAAMQQQPPASNPSTVERVVAALSTPRTAVTLAVVAGVIALFSPLLVHGARLMVLESKLSDLETNRAEVEQLDRRLAMYEAMRNRSWPMTKIISDVVNNAPQGIELESISVSFGEGDAIMISGHAVEQNGQSPSEIAYLMEDQLQATGIFQHPRVNLDSPNVHGDQYRFRLNAYVSDPLRIRDYDETEDFAKLTLRQRLYPELLEQEQPGETGLTVPGAGEVREPADDPSTTDPPRLAQGEQTSPRQAGESPSGDGPSAAGAEPRGPADHDSQGAGDRGESDQQASRPDRPDRPDSPFGQGRTRPDGDRRSEGDDTEVAGPQSIPDELSARQVEAMSPDEARRLMAEYARAMRLSGLDDETSERLRNDFNLLRQRARNR